MSTFDRDRARDVLRMPDWGDRNSENLLDALALCWIETPHTMDRDALERVLSGWFPTAMAPFVPKLAEQILALVRPVDGIVLTPEEAALASQGLSAWRSEFETGRPDEDWSDVEELAARLEAQS